MVVARLGILQSLVRGEIFDRRCVVAAVVQLGVRIYIVSDMCAYDTVAAVVEVYGNRRQQFCSFVTFVFGRACRDGCELAW